MRLLMDCVQLLAGFPPTPSLSWPGILATPAPAWAGSRPHVVVLPRVARGDGEVREFSEQPLNQAGLLALEIIHLKHPLAQPRRSDGQHLAYPASQIG